MKTRMRRRAGARDDLDAATALEGPPPAPGVPRSGRSAWRDPRLALGLVLIGASVAGGAMLLNSADSSVPVWSVVDRVSAGQPISTEDLEVRRVRFVDQETADVYLPGDAKLPDGAVAGHDLTAGQLVPRAVIATSADKLIEVPLSVVPSGLPASLRTGAAVDVWLVPETAAAESDETRPATRMLVGATLVHLGRSAGALAVSGERSVVVGVPEADEKQVAELLGQLAGSRVILTRKS